MDKSSVGMFLIGIGLGIYIPKSFPSPFDFINPWFGLIFIAIGVFLIAKG